MIVAVAIYYQKKKPKKTPCIYSQNYFSHHPY